MKFYQPKLDQDFLRGYQQENLEPAKKSAIFAVVFYLLFSVLDAYLTGSSQIVSVRIVITIIMASITSLAYLDKFKAHWQKIYCLFIIVAGLGIIVLSTYIKCPLKTLYSQGLLLVIFYGYTMNRLLLIPATIAGFTIAIVYIIVVLNTKQIETTSILTSLFFLLSANVFGIFNISYKQRILIKDYQLKIKDKKKSKKLIELNEKLKSLASTDGLTGIANRRYFDETLNQAIEQSKCKKTPLTLIMVDIDYFKLYNDYYGHVKGDTCLKAIANLLQSSTSYTEGLAARFGGEEFTILLPNTSYLDSEKIVINIINGLRALKIESHDSPLSDYVTASYGIATACENYQALSAKGLVTSADACLYQAKKSGRNKYAGIVI